MKKFNADRLNNLIHDKGVTAKEVSEATGITESLMCHYRAGNRSPNLKNAALLADYFNTTVDALIAE